MVGNWCLDGNYLYSVSKELAVALYCHSHSQDNLMSMSQPICNNTSRYAQL